MNAPFIDPTSKWHGHIAKALRRCNMKIDVSEIINQIYNRQLLFAESSCGKAFAVIQINELAPAQYVVHLYIMGGEREGILELEKTIVEYARSIKALKVTAITRKGFAAKNSWWRRNTEGWKNPCDWIEKEI